MENELAIDHFILFCFYIGVGGTAMLAVATAVRAVINRCGGNAR
jgi:hypothetical protein